MVKRTVLKVNIDCAKCKKKLLKIVSSLQGIDKIEVDEGKGTLTVTGDADPYEIILRIRTAGKHAEVVSIGPPPAPPKPEPQKKPEDKKPEDKKPEDKRKQPEDKQPEPVKLDQVYYMPYNSMYNMPHYCPPVVHINRWDEPNPSCSIM